MIYCDRHLSDHKSFCKQDIIEANPYVIVLRTRLRTRKCLFGYLAPWLGLVISFGRRALPYPYFVFSQGTSTTIGSVGGYMIPHPQPPGWHFLSVSMLYQ